MKIMKLWFQDPSKYQQAISRLGISEEKYRYIIDLVVRTFPKDWADSKLADIKKKSNFLHCDLWPSLLCGLRYNPVPMILAGVTGGYMPVIAIIRLGQLLQKAEQLPNKKTLIKRLMGNPDDYISALFELEAFEFFSNLGFSLACDPEEDGVDYTFQKDGRKIFVEVTHRGPSWVMEVFDRVGQTITEPTNVNFSKCIHINYRIAKEFVDLNGVDELVFDIDRVLAKKVETSYTVKDKGFRFQVEYKKSEEGGLTLKWHETTDWAYEAAELFKGRMNDKVEQLSRNEPSFCAIDMRSVIPSLIVTDWKDTSDICAEFIQKLFKAGHDFVVENICVGGIFVWIKHVGRTKDLIIDTLNQDEVILINAKSSFSDEAATKLFPCAVLPKYLKWYCEKDLFLP